MFSAEPSCGWFTPPHKDLPLIQPSQLLVVAFKQHRECARFLVRAGSDWPLSHRAKFGDSDVTAVPADRRDVCHMAGVLALLFCLSF